MKISVIIPVYNEIDNIEETMSALLNNSELPNEIIVVDGGSTDGTVDLIKERYPMVHIYHNAKKTAASGRNIGIKKATGEIIAFTDGDCVVDFDWIKNIKLAFSDSSLDGIGGRVLNATPRNRYERYWGNLAWNLIMNFPDKEYVVDRQTLNDAFVTANCAYKKELLVKIHGFNNWFANNAEDVDLCWRALKAGAHLKYIPNIVIYAHNVTTLKGIAQKSFRNGVSSSKLQKIYGGKFNFDPTIYKMLGQNIVGLIKGKKDSELNLIELGSHLFGKYYGSIKVGVINI